MTKEKEPFDEVDDLQPEYDFSNGVRGKYLKPGLSRIRVTIEKDVARYYSSPDLVNAALRQLIAEGRAPTRAASDMTLRISWDSVKAAENYRKHGVSFDEAREVFTDPLRATENDYSHSDDEDRYTSFGATAAGKVLFVVYTIQEEVVHLISARLATRSERRSYMDEEQKIYDEPMEPGDEETSHFDWSRAVRGLHYIPWVKGTATLDEDVYSIFRTSEEVNNALRMLIREGRIPHFPLGRGVVRETQEVTEESASPPARPGRRGGARRR
jgi:uncharacterized DUF497 family protein